MDSSPFVTYLTLVSFVSLKPLVAASSEVLQNWLFLITIDGLMTIIVYFGYLFHLCVCPWFVPKHKIIDIIFFFVLLAFDIRC